MHILQISDFHFTEIMTKEKEQQIIKMIDIVKSNLLVGEKLIISIIGDLTEGGNPENYKFADDAFNVLIENISDINYVMEILPGNHDICEGSLKDFHEFANKFRTIPWTEGAKACAKHTVEGIDHVFVSSVQHLNFRYGVIDLKPFKTVLQESKNPKVVYTHHTFFSRYEDDASGIRNAYVIFESLERNQVTAVIHGHTHGYSSIKLDSGCNIIGVGPFCNKVPDVNTQFNLLCVDNYGIKSILNCRYQADLEKYYEQQTYKVEDRNAFINDKFSDAYNHIIHATEAAGCIYNFQLDISSSFDDFQNDLADNFSDALLEAELWQQVPVPDSLHYNHAQFINKNGVSGIQYIVDELKNKATSSRALFSLINNDNIFDSKDGFLPSFNIVQFSFTDESRQTLQATLYLRAIEVENFLPINICEMYILVKLIKSSIRSLEHVNIRINAFRAQRIKNFCCFKKAQIDSYTSIQAFILIQNVDITKIIGLLQEKLDFVETVVITDGVEVFCEAMIEFYNTDKSKYGVAILDSILEIKRCIDEYKLIRSRTSLTKAIEEKEREYANSVQTLILLLKEEKNSGNNRIVN